VEVGERLAARDKVEDVPCEGACLGDVCAFQGWGDVRVSYSRYAAEDN
jgi:hypothetical protein